MVGVYDGKELLPVGVHIGQQVGHVGGQGAGPLPDQVGDPVGHGIFLDGQDGLGHLHKGTVFTGAGGVAAGVLAGELEDGEAPLGHGDGADVTVGAGAGAAHQTAALVDDPAEAEPPGPEGVGQALGGGGVPAAELLIIAEGQVDVVFRLPALGDQPLDGLQGSQELAFAVA